MRTRVWLVCLCMSFALLSIACGEVQTEIHESRVQLNTSDTKGPYEIMTVVTSNSTPITVHLIYSTDGWKTQKTLDMQASTSVGEDVYVGKIPGQAAGKTIQYFIRVSDNQSRITTDPLRVPPNPKAIAYKFSILSTP